MNVSDPKSCDLCGFVDSLGECFTCPNDGEASWTALAPTFVPEQDPEPEPAKPKAKGKSGGK